MNFGLVLKYMTELFDKNNIPYAIIGGFALDLHGLTRTTKDLDFIVPLENINKIDEYLTTHGYEKLFKSNDIASYISDNLELGRIDFLLAHREYTNEMLKNTVIFDNKAGSLKLKVVKLEDLIGLKLQAYFNRKERKMIDIEDIKNIIKMYKAKLDYNKVKEYFLFFNAPDLLKQVWEGN